MDPTSEVYPPYRLVAEFMDGSRLLFDGLTEQQAMDALDLGKPHGIHVRYVQMASLPANIANGIGPSIAKIRRIRQAANARAIQYH